MGSPHIDIPRNSTQETAVLSSTYRHEFDEYASDYFKSLGHPIRGLIKDTYYFIHTKANIINNVVSTHFKDCDYVNIIDVGAGIGLFEKFIHDEKIHIFGIDVSFKMLQVAIAIGNIDTKCYCQADAEQLPLPDNSADIIFSSCVLHHISDEKIENVIKDLKRVCRPGGMIFIFEHNPYNLLTQLVVKTTRLDRKARLIPSKKLLTMANHLGLTKIKIEYILYGSLGFDKFISSRLSFLTGLPFGGQYYIVFQKK
jgi:2-polyprenyl-3-methyl-5-hydroxy-6-metoxy-1,4-benzoquinol methylase